MFDRTIRMLEKCKDDARAFSYFSTLITQSFFIVYYIGILLLSLGHPIIYGILLALTAAALLFFMITESPHGVKSFKIRRWVRIFTRYAKYCLHLVAICLTLYTFYADTQAMSPLALILLILAILAFLIQLIGEIVGFLSRRYFEELLAAALADTELLRSILDKVQNGAERLQRMKEGISSFPGRAAEKANTWGSAMKERFSVFKRKKKKTPKIPELIEGEFTEKEEETTPSDV